MKKLCDSLKDVFNSENRLSLKGPSISYFVFFRCAPGDFIMLPDIRDMLAEALYGQTR